MVTVTPPTRAGAGGLAAEPALTTQPQGAVLPPRALSAVRASPAQRRGRAAALRARRGILSRDSNPHVQNPTNLIR